MNNSILTALLLIIIFFIYCGSRAQEMFNSSPEEAVVMEDVITDVPVAAGPVMNSDFDVDLPSMIENGQPTAPAPQGESDIGYYNFAKTMYM